YQTGGNDKAISTSEIRVNFARHFTTSRLCADNGRRKHCLVFTSAPPIFVPLFVHRRANELRKSVHNVSAANNLAHSININNNNNNINAQLQSLQHTMASMPTYNNNNNNEGMYHHQLNSFSNATHELMLELRQGLLTKSTKFDEFFRSLLASSKAEFHRMFIRTYGILYENNAEIFTGMYENLENYYATGGVKLNDAMQSFFNRLYQKMFQVLNMQYDFSPAYLNCTSQQLDKLRPFGAVPDKLITEIKQSFIATRTFVQALNNGIDVIKNLIALGPSAQCNTLLQRVHQLVATSPQAVASRPICVSHCEQIWTKCYNKLNVDLDREWNSYVEALSSLANKMRTSWNIEIVVKPIDIRVSEAIMNFQENGPQITNQVFKACGDPKQAMLGRRKRFADVDFELIAARKDCNELWAAFSKTPTPNSESLQQMSADLIEFRRRCSSYPRPRSLARMSERECARLAALPVKEYFPTRIEQATYQLSKKVYELNCLESKQPPNSGVIPPRRLVTASIVPTKPDYTNVDNSRRVPVFNRRNDTAFIADSPSVVPVRGVSSAAVPTSVPVAMKSTSHKNTNHAHRETTTTLAPISEVQNIEIIGALVSEICDQINRTKGFWSALPNNVCTNKNVVGSQNLKQLQAPPNCTGFPPHILSDSITNDRYFKGSDRASVNDARYNGVITQQITTLKSVVSKINKAIGGHEVDWAEPVAITMTTTTTTTTAIPNVPPSEIDSLPTTTTSDPDREPDNDQTNECPPGYEPIPDSNISSDEDLSIETGSGNGPNNDDEEGDETGDGDDEESESGTDEDSDSEDSGMQNQPSRSQLSCRPIELASTTTSTAKPDDSSTTNSFKDIEETGTTISGNYIEGLEQPYIQSYASDRIHRKNEVAIILGDPDSSSGQTHFAPACLSTYAIIWLGSCVIRQFAYDQPIQFH
ncbi:Glypican-6, partial [Fragariocoptes setiger]